MKEKLKKKNMIHNGSFMDLYEDDVILPHDKAGKRLYVKHPGGAGILAITPDDKVILVKQYRYATGEYIIEIPAGKHDNHDDPIITAKRELAEETGYTSDDINFLTSIYPTPGYSDEIITIYVAHNVHEMPEKIKGDDDEFITILTYDRAQIKAFINAGHVMDAKTLIALQYFLNM